MAPEKGVLTSSCVSCLTPSQVPPRLEHTAVRASLQPINRVLGAQGNVLAWLRALLFLYNTFTTVAPHVFTPHPSILNYSQNVFCILQKEMFLVRGKA